MLVFVLFSIISAFLSNFVVSASSHSKRALSLHSRPSNSQISDFLNAHNSIRAAHNASPLSWSKELAAKAADWADECLLRLTDGVLSSMPYGELQVAGSGSKLSKRNAGGDFSIQDAVDTFVQDEPNYNPDRPVLSHFTQVVWKATTQVGCASKQCEGLLEPNVSGRAGTGNLLDGTYYVCLYTPPGNVVGGEKENVEL